MAERPESSSSQGEGSTSTKDDLKESTAPQIEQQNVANEQLLQEVVEVDGHPDCPVCLQPASYPVKLPCGHVFCFLCIKGVALRGRKCAICRQVIPADVLEKPTLVKVSATCLEQSVQDETEEYVWYYEGRNGWWQYDDKTSKEVEASFKNGKRSCTLLIAGFLYLIDFENMFQMRRNEPGRRRRIKRDKRDVDSKGVAGIRLPSKQTTSHQNNNDSSSNTNSNKEKNDNKPSSQRVKNQKCEATCSDAASSSSESQGDASNTSSTTITSSATNISSGTKTSGASSLSGGTNVFSATDTTGATNTSQSSVRDTILSPKDTPGATDMSQATNTTQCGDTDMSGATDTSDVKESSSTSNDIDLFSSKVV